IKHGLAAFLVSSEALSRFVVCIKSTGRLHSVLFVTEWTGWIVVSRQVLLQIGAGCDGAGEGVFDAAAVTVA
ncbi:MAG: hypothetical protein K8R55_05470, partial [Desulfuromonadaceae bacterium]|nr:hypothetical protein [Desulfuromonadaceae bacterium]